VVVDVHAARVSFNGGSGGTTTTPTPQEEAAARERRVATLPAQLQHERIASANKSLLASENHGRPAIAATAKPGEFAGKGVVAAREAERSIAPTTKPAEHPMISPNAAEPQNLENKNRAKEEERATQPGERALVKPLETEKENPAKAAKPEQQSPPPRPPAQAAVKPLPTPQPAHSECPPGKRLVEVGGRRECR
jgi:hypothetical protein